MNKKEIETTIDNYSLYLREIVRLREELHTAGERLTRPYGIESTLPKPQGDHTDPVHQEAVRRAKKWDRLAELEQRTNYILVRIDRIQDEKEIIIMDLLMDGKNLHEISQHMCVSRGSVQRLRESIVDQLLDHVIVG